MTVLSSISSNRRHDRQPNTSNGAFVSTRRFAALCCVVLIGLVVAVYGQVTQGMWPNSAAKQFEFMLLDDGDYVFTNPWIKKGVSAESINWAFTTYYAANWHPLTWLSLMLDFELYGLNPGGYHLTNALLHAANAVLLFLFLKRITRDVVLGFIVAALWAVHPLHVESVAWVAERKDVLSTFFALVALLGYEAYARRPGIARYAVTLGAFCLSLLAKQMWITLPCLLILLDYWPLARTRLNAAPPPDSPYPIQSVSRLLLEKLPFFLLTLAFSVLVFVVQQRGGAVSDFDNVPRMLRLQNASISYWIYVVKAFWPTRLGVLYPLWNDLYPRGLWIVCALLLVGTTILAIVGRGRFPWFTVGWLWYVGMLVPVIGFVQIGSQAWADRYSYAPHIGLFIAVVWGTANILRSAGRGATPVLLQRVGALCAGVVIVALAITGHRQVSYWESSESLFKHTVAITDRNYRIATSLASHLTAHERVEEAKVYYRQALEFNPNGAEALCALAGAIARHGNDWDEAQRLFERSLESEPDRARTKVDYAMELIDHDEVDRGLRLVDEALAAEPLMPWAYTVQGMGYARIGKLDEAVASYRKGLEIDALDQTLLNSLGDLYFGMSDYRQAKQWYQRIFETWPNDGETHIDYGTVLAQEGDLDGALAHFRRGVAESPNFADGHNKLGKALMSKGQALEAVQSFEKAIELRPEEAAPMNDLAWLLATDPQFRSSQKRAVELATKACDLTKRKDPSMLDTLAVAQANAEQWDAAISTAEAAIALANETGQAPMAAEIGERLKLYRNHQPYRTPAQPATPNS